jgi:hypothetical protein
MYRYVFKIKSTTGPLKEMTVESNELRYWYRYRTVSGTKQSFLDLKKNSMAGQGSRKETSRNLD